MGKAGFARHLDAEQIRLYKADWEDHVRRRRANRNLLGIETGVTEQDIQAKEFRQNEIPRQDRIPNQSRLLDYIRSLPTMRRAAYTLARPLWEAGTTRSMVLGSTQVVDIYEQMLITLCNYYPDSHFAESPIEDYIRYLIDARFNWYRACSEPLGMGTGGTMVHYIVPGNVMEDLESMISQTASNLLERCDYEESGFTNVVDPDAWRKEWEQVGDQRSPDASLSNHAHRPLGVSPE
jgi:hypothetical protein